MAETPPPPAPQQDACSPRVWGPFCEAFQLTRPEEACAQLAHVAIFLTPPNSGEVLFGHFCRSCWANHRLRPQQPFVVRQVSGWRPARRG